MIAQTGSRFLVRALRALSSVILATVLASQLFANESVDTIPAERVLSFSGADGQTITLSIEEMSDRFGLETIDVYDLEFQRLKTFEGVSLRDLLEFLDVEPSEQLIFVATDGYQISFDSSLLLQADLNPVVAFRDLDAEAGLNWEPFQHGRHLVNFDPFYLVWGIENDNLDAPDIPRLSTLPWPYQMNEIRIVSPDQYAAAAPTEMMGEEAMSGFDLYVKHCIKCHQVKGLGGLLGPAIDRENSMASLIDSAFLKEMIWKVNDYIPGTKMPDYRNTLSEPDVENLVVYLKAIQQTGAQ